ncbi:HK97 gp10 family phage protein [Ferroglobus placidus]|uniref:HK97 gp10 family phage protein n=1 Tax=Ferroglobus placidus TaxID=54261 RepID=UPI00064ED8FB|nr:HK97 gp10 family phage protein [Ferroglobus placidus]
MGRRIGLSTARRLKARGRTSTRVGTSGSVPVAGSRTSLGISIRIEGLDRTIKNLEDLKKSLPDKVDKKLQMAVFELEGEIKATAPVRTGRYRAAWVSTKLGKLKYAISNNVEYAKYLIYGTSKMPVKHDVRGIVERWRGRIKRMLKTIK